MYNHINRTGEKLKMAIFKCYAPLVLTVPETKLRTRVPMLARTPACERVNDENGIFKAFDMEKFFDKESLLDTVHTIHRGQIKQQISQNVV